MKMKVVVNPTYHSLMSFITSLPECFGKEGTVIYEGRNHLKRFDIETVQLTVKSFRILKFFNRIIYTFFRSSKAKRSYLHGMTLLEKGINTPEPVAYIENRKRGLLSDSYYICMYFESDGMMREFHRGTLVGREMLLQQFARFTASLHEQAVHPLDYSPGNILYQVKDEQYSFSLVDINRMRFETVGMKTGCESLRRLWGSHEMITFIAAEYARARGFDIETCVRLCLYYHARFWKRYSRRHNGFQPYGE